MLKHLNEPKTISEAALYPNLYIYQKVDAVISQVNVVSESSDVLFHRLIRNSQTHVHTVFIHVFMLSDTQGYRKRDTSRLC